MKRFAWVLLFLAVSILMLHDHIARTQTSSTPALHANAHVPSSVALGSVHELLHAYLLPQEQEWRMPPIALARPALESMDLFDSLNTAPPLHPPSI